MGSSPRAAVASSQDSQASPRSDVLPLVLDILAKEAERLAARLGAIDGDPDRCGEEIGWVGLHARQTIAPGPIEA